MLSVRLMPNTMDTIFTMEMLRNNAYGNSEIKENINSKYKDLIMDCEIYVFGLFNDEELVAGIYLSDLCDGIFVDNLFVKKIYQGSKLYYGRYLLQYILDNKELFEKLVFRKFDKSSLYYLNDYSKKIYEDMGYESVDDVTGHYMELKLINGK